MISDSGGARAEFTEQIAECDVWRVIRRQNVRQEGMPGARCLVHARGAPLRPEMVQFYNSHLSWSYFQGGNYSNFPFSRAFPRDIFVYNPILWVSHSHSQVDQLAQLQIHFVMNTLVSGGSHVVTVSSHHTSRVTLLITLLALIRIQSPRWQRWWHAHRVSQMEI